MDNTKTKCLTVDKLMGINEKFGSATNLELSLDINSTQVRKKTIQILSDPFLRKNKPNFNSTIGTSKLFATNDIFTPSVHGSTEFKP